MLPKTFSNNANSNPEMGRKLDLKNNTKSVNENMLKISYTLKNYETVSKGGQSDNDIHFIDLFYKKYLASLNAD